MKLGRRHCANCDHFHAWRILHYSPDMVPLYGANPCDDCDCNRFVEKVEGMEDLPALTNDEVKDLWAATSFLNPQVPMATRIAVRQITELLKSEDQNALLTKALPEFAGLLISQITDIRGAMTRDDSKFAHLVAHADEIVEAMRGVVQLSERLTNIYAVQERILEALDRLGGKEQPPAGDDECICGDPWGNHDERNAMCLRVGCDCSGFARRIGEKEAAHVFTSESAPLRNEPIVTDADSTDD